MRDYIRHPADIPIEVLINNITPSSQKCMDGVMQIERMENVSSGGLMFQSSIPYAQNSEVVIKINSVNPIFEAHALVTWCRKSARNYLVGLEFADENNDFKVRMVEQVCHIMHYRNEVMTTEGRELNSDEAAKEWIEHHAADFPK